MRLGWIFIGTMLFGTLLSAQGTSPHQWQLEEYYRADFSRERDYDKAFRITNQGKRNSAQKCTMQRQVYGFHPAWRGTAYENYDFGLLFAIAYFGAEIDPAGGFRTTHLWRETRLVELAHGRGSRVDLTVYSYDPAANRRFLADETARAATIDSLVALLKAQDGDGVCLDMQGIAADNADQFSSFIRQMALALAREKSYWQLSVVLPSDAAALPLDFPALAPFVDRYLMMGYDQRGPRAPFAGPNLPLRAGAPWGERSVERALDRYLSRGIPKEKLLLGIPYFGYQWSTESKEVGARTLASARTLPYQEISRLARLHPPQLDTASGNSYLAWTEGATAQQVWGPTIQSLPRKYQMVKKKGIAGVAIWALGYDHGEDALWGLIRDYFADCDAMATQRDNERRKVLDGPTSAERNRNNWIWIVVGMIGLIGFIIFARRLK
ncbi:MAG: glycosyl hydrolase family 18 protein [Bacteroidota bacterium]